MKVGKRAFQRFISSSAKTGTNRHYAISQSSCRVIISSSRRVPDKSVPSRHIDKNQSETRIEYSIGQVFSNQRLVSRLHICCIIQDGEQRVYVPKRSVFRPRTSRFVLFHRKFSLSAPYDAPFFPNRALSRSIDNIYFA